MVAFPVWLAVGGVLVALVVAVVGILGLGRSLTPAETGIGLDPLAHLTHLQPWFAAERVRLFSAALLGAITAAGSMTVALRSTWGAGIYLAGGIGALAFLVAVWWMPTSEPATPPALPHREPARLARGVRWGIGLTAVACLISVAMGIGVATVAVSALGGQWALPYRQMQSIDQSASGAIEVTYAQGYLTPWLGWPDVAILAGVAVVVLVLLFVVLRRLGPDVDLGDVEGVHDLRRFVVAAVTSGGMLAQVGTIGFGVGVLLASLTDIDRTPTANGWVGTVSVQPHATIGASMAVVGVVALILASVQLVLAGHGLMRLGHYPGAGPAARQR